MAKTSPTPVTGKRQETSGGEWATAGSLVPVGDSVLGQRRYHRGSPSVFLVLAHPGGELASGFCSCPKRSGGISVLLVADLGRQRLANCHDGATGGTGTCRSLRSSRLAIPLPIIRNGTV
jgi:hypothetical protein